MHLIQSQTGLKCLRQKLGMPTKLSNKTLSVAESKAYEQQRVAFKVHRFENACASRFQRKVIQMWMHSLKAAQNARRMNCAQKQLVARFSFNRWLRLLKAAQNARRLIITTIEIYESIAATAAHELQVLNQVNNETEWGTYTCIRLAIHIELADIVRNALNYKGEDLLQFMETRFLKHGSRAGKARSEI